jgi:hypothetical protein
MSEFDFLAIIYTLHQLGYFPKASPYSSYTRRRAREILRDNPHLAEILAHPHEILQPNNPAIWEAGGFQRVKGFIITRNYAVRDYYLFESGKAETYRAANFYGEFYGQFVRTIDLPDFLAEVCEGPKFYDQITLREGDRGYYGLTESGRGLLFDDACLLLEWLEKGGSGQKGRDAGTYEYIQVIFIIWGKHE